MDHDDELNDMRIQFQELQKQQEKRKLERKKEKVIDKHYDDAQDDLDLSKQGIVSDNLENRWFLKNCLTSCCLNLLGTLQINNEHTTI